MNQRTEHNNALILAALAQGRLRTDPDAGRVWLDGELQTELLSGYVRITLDGHLFGAHRVIWLDAHGHIPPGYWINHINRVRHDNRMPNLEAVTPRQNRLHAVDSWWPRPLLRAEDLADVADRQPDWLAEVLAAAQDPDVTPERIEQLRADARPQPGMRVLSSRSVAHVKG